jgi:hypothetical protein
MVLQGKLVDKRSLACPQKLTCQKALEHNLNLCATAMQQISRFVSSWVTSQRKIEVQNPMLKIEFRL